jgi:hypothetical protein
MKKLALALLVGAAALAPLTLSAQTVPDPDPFYGIPNISLNIPTAAAAPAAMTPPPVHAGTTWTPGPVGGPTVQGGGGPVQTRVYMRRMGPGPGPAGSGQVQTRVYGGGMTPPPGGGMNMGPQRHMMMMHGGMGMGGHRADHWQRIGRGGVLPPMWWGPQFTIGDWGTYGFPPPVSGGRWIRYYDDALMVGPDGRVIDGRYGYDWDRYGDRWSYDDDGVPMAMGDQGYRDEDEWGDRDDREGPPPPPRPMHRGYGYGYGYGGGCGCGYGAPVLVSETIVTEPPVVETRTYVTTYVERTRVVHRYRPRTKLIRRAPPPRAGERG